jgi:hypothetical protein
VRKFTNDILAVDAAPGAFGNKEALQLPLIINAQLDAMFVDGEAKAAAVNAGETTKAKEFGFDFAADRANAAVIPAAAMQEFYFGTVDFEGFITNVRNTLGISAAADEPRNDMLKYLSLARLGANKPTTMLTTEAIKESLRSAELDMGKSKFKKSIKSSVAKTVKSFFNSKTDVLDNLNKIITKITKTEKIIISKQELLLLPQIR